MIKPTIAIIGAGFAGIAAAQALRNAEVDVVLIDQRNHFVFQALLYQVATAGLEPEAIAHSVRGIFAKQKNVHVRMDTVSGVDLAKRTLTLGSGAQQPYDKLILATGAVTHDFGIAGVQAHGFGLKNLSEAVAFREHVLHQFEIADRAGAAMLPGTLTFVVVGGGPTGVEIAGALVELFDMVLRKDFARLDYAQVKVMLLEAADSVLAAFDPSLRAYTQGVLRKRGVDVRLGAQVTEITPDAVLLKDGTRIPAHTCFWSAGVKASPLVAQLGLPVGRGGRAIVNDDLSVAGHPDVFVIGDLAAGKDAGGGVYPQIATSAIYSGTHAARNIMRNLHGEPTLPFAYRDPGFMATIGRNEAVAQFPNGWKFKGRIAWLMWLGLHLLRLVGFRNRLTVLVNWAVSYFTYERGPRLIFRSK